MFAQSIGLVNIWNCANCANIPAMGDTGADNDYDPQANAVAIHPWLAKGSIDRVMLTHENLQTMISNVQYYTDDLKKPKVLQHCHWSHENALFEILFALTYGGTLILAAGQDDPATISMLMQQENINFTLASSSQYWAWFRSSSQVLKTCSKWKLAFCSGGNISTTLAKRFSNLEIDGLKLMSVHGISTCPVTACVGMIGFKKYAALSADSTMPAGIAMPNRLVLRAKHKYFD
jgi:hypothetical protein